MPLLAAPDWDEEAIEEAEYRARAIAPFDEEAAADMRAMASAARAKLTGQPMNTARREPYDATRIYARACKFYAGWTPQSIDQMHFPLFFAMMREANEINDDEEKAYERARRGQGQTATPEQALGMFPAAEKYGGETVSIK